MQGSANLNVMIKAARKAGRSLVKDFREVENLQVSSKGPGDFVTRADREAERIIKEELMTARPTYGWLGEETGEEAGEDPTRRWIVDPLDGTTNFLHGLPHFAISIAAQREGEIVAGLIYNPVTDEMFWSEKGLGAFGNNKRMRVSARSDLSESLIATGIPFKGSSYRPANYMPELAAIMPHVAGIRRFGSAALDLAYVACGRFDAYWETGIKPWDIAAGFLMVKEAGGFIAPMKTGTDPIKDGNIIATNAALHDKIVKMLRDAKA